MESVVKPVQGGRGRRGRWPVDEKLAVLQEWRTGVLLEEACRRYGVNVAQVYRWKRSLDRGLKESGERIPKSQVAGLQRRIDDLERGLGRKALEVEVLKEAFEFKGLKLPEGMSGG